MYPEDVARYCVERPVLVAAILGRPRRASGLSHLGLYQQGGLLRLYRPCHRSLSVRFVDMAAPRFRKNSARTLFSAGN